MKELSLKNNEKIVISAKKSIHKMPFIISLVCMGILSIIFISVYFSMKDRLDWSALTILSFGLFFFVIFAILDIIYIIINLNKNSPLILTNQRILIYSYNKGYADVDLKNLISWNHRVVRSYSTFRIKNGMCFAGVFHFETGGQKYKTLKIKNYEEVISALNKIKVN